MGNLIHTVEVYTANNAFEASVFRGQLYSVGIDSRVEDASTADSPRKIYVAEFDSVYARDIAAEFRERKAHATNSLDRLEHESYCCFCGDPVTPQVPSCPSCECPLEWDPVF